MFARLASVSVALFLAAGPSLAQDPFHGPEKVPIDIGSVAPALHVAVWVKGSPVPSFVEGRIYVIESWATWSGPCMTRMPELSATQRRYREKGVTVIGLSSRDPRNDLPAVEAMVKQKGDLVDYTVAWDKDGWTRTAYMEASGHKEIPFTFVVDGAGKIAYMGNSAFLDPSLERILAGTWDAKKGNAAVDAASKALGAIAMSVENDPKAALARVSEFEATYPEYAKIVAVLKFEAMLAAGDCPAAYAWASKVVDDAIAHGDAEALNGVAWTVVNPRRNWATVDLDLARRAAENCVAFTDGKDGGLLDTLARVWYLKGDVAKAIEIETKALAVSSGMVKDEVEKALAEYKAKASRG